MLRRVGLERIDVSEERIATTIRVKGMSLLGTTLAVTSCVLRLLVIANILPSSPILVTLMMEAIRSSETSVFTRATRRDMSEDGILLIVIVFALECCNYLHLWVNIVLIE
jgi:hypothetical protein